MKLQLFNYEENQVRVVEKKGEFWWIAKDVCSALGLANVSKAMNGISENRKGIIECNTPGGIQNLWAVNEPGLYQLIFKSRKEDASAFQNWVFEKVLPSLRKTGQYSIQPVQDEKSPLRLQAEMLLNMIDSQERIEREQAVQRSELAEVRKISLETKEKLEKPETIEVTHYTVVGWAKRLNLIIPDDPFGGLIGRKLSSICRLKGIDPEEKKLDHGKHGYVNRYPKEILETHFIPYYEEALAKREEKKAKAKA